MTIDRKCLGVRTAARWQSVKALAGVCLGLLAWAVTAVGDDAPPAKPIDFAHDIAPLIKAALRQVPHRRQVQGLVLARHARDDAQVGGRRPRQERRERADRAAHVRRPRVPHAPEGDAAHGRRGRPAQGVDRPGGSLGDRASRSSGPAMPPRSSFVAPSCPPRATAATTRSIASSTPISPRTESTPPRRSTTRRLLAGCSST